MASDPGARLAELGRLHLRRRPRVVRSAAGPRALLEGREVVLLCSNNYLGLADHPRVREAAAQAALRYGASAGASRLVCGTLELHRRLEDRLAAFKGYPAAVLFGSGYLANVGAVSALAGEGDAVFSDSLNHASLIDGCRLSRARTRVYRHRDTDHLAQLLRETPARNRLIVTDSVFSMDGDRAPLAELVELARRHRALLLVDEAHATGAVGPSGRGLVAAAGLEGEVDLVVGTLGKALGSYGAYICASAELVELLINTARPLIFSTAPPPASTAAALAALELLEQEPTLVERLQANARHLRERLLERGFAVQANGVQIVPLVVGEPQAALALSAALERRGVFVGAIRPPSVPPRTSRLRLTVSAAHETADLDRAAEALLEAARELGLDPRRIGEPQPALVAAAG